MITYLQYGGLGTLPVRVITGGVVGTSAEAPHTAVLLIPAQTRAAVCTHRRTFVDLD